MHSIENIETIHDGWGRFHVVTVSRGDGGTMLRQVEDHGDAVCVLPYDPVREVATLVRQPRIAPLFRGADALLLEVPAGLTDGEAPADAAMREVLEETGLQLGALTPAGSLWSMPGCATERMHCFLAAYSAADKVGEGGGVADEHEEIEVVELALTEADEMVRDGRISDMKTVYLLQTLKLQGIESGAVSRRS
ncbi:NUDIX domain-containing protein [Oricola cellulosilytica]|uniref:NUDIX domain-containing protein n=1 Tax=Oricola cellulosilytica TaxID=1429082 RepID=UPI001CBD28DF|nr:NUDIX domain-containing protein [Oricola cellulosilytica]